MINRNTITVERLSPEDVNKDMLDALRGVRSQHLLRLGLPENQLGGRPSDGGMHGALCGAYFSEGYRSVDDLRRTLEGGAELFIGRTDNGDAIATGKLWRERSKDMLGVNWLERGLAKACRMLGYCHSVRFAGDFVDQDDERNAALLRRMIIESDLIQSQNGPVRVISYSHPNDMSLREAMRQQAEGNGGVFYEKRGLVVPVGDKGGSASVELPCDRISIQLHPSLVGGQAVRRCVTGS